MLPATMTRSSPRPRRNTWPVRLVVVVLPLVPVIATMGASQNQDAASISEYTESPARRACCTMFDCVGTPGLSTMKSASIARAVCPSNS